MPVSTVTSRLTRVEGSLYLRLQPGYRHVACGERPAPITINDTIIMASTSSSSSSSYHERRKQRRHNRYHISVLYNSNCVDGGSKQAIFQHFYQYALSRRVQYHSRQGAVRTVLRGCNIEESTHLLYFRP